MSLAYSQDLTSKQITANKYQRTVAAWLYTGVGMLLIQVILGGITRLTGSGLSITEWNVVTGTLPPLTHTAWLAEFGKYRQTPQYLLLNNDFQLADFKFIFFWEWLHRAWARLIAFAFLIPFVYFIIKGAITGKMIRPLIILFLLGALQGAVGWIMVASGLVGDAVYVKPVKLAVHFVLALGLICYAFWFSLAMSVPVLKPVKSKGLKRITWFIIIILFVQLLFGALMAGHKAAAAAPTWPTINGEWFPSVYNANGSLYLQLVENKIVIHFMHRLFAYILLALSLGWTYTAFQTSTVNASIKKARYIPLLIVVLQVLLGIFTVLSSPGIIPNRWVGFDWLALFHQVTGMAFLLSMIYILYLIYGRIEHRHAS
ncbi:MAG: COX15/CtaA family protein [Chitinophagaceae bacterium]